MKDLIVLLIYQFLKEKSTKFYDGFLLGIRNKRIVVRILEESKEDSFVLHTIDLVK